MIEGKQILWNKEKSVQLKHIRGVSFEDMLPILKDGSGILDEVDHPNQTSYPGQRIFILRYNEYVYCIPFVETDTTYFLKTIFPNRKLNKQYPL